MTLSFATLLDWVEGRLPAAEAEAVAAAVAAPGEDGAEMRNTIAWLRAFHHLGEELVLSDPPAHVSRALRCQFAGRAGRPAEEAPSLIRV